MIEYNVKIQGSKIVDSFKHSDTSMSEISILTFLLHKKIVELSQCDSKKKFSIKYPIDKEGKFKKENG